MMEEWNGGIMGKAGDFLFLSPFGFPNIPLFQNSNIPYF